MINDLQKTLNDIKFLLNSINHPIEENGKNLSSVDRNGIYNNVCHTKSGTKYLASERKTKF